MPDMRFTCDECKKPIPSLDGHIYVLMHDVEVAEIAAPALREEFSTELPGGGRAYSGADLLRMPDKTARWRTVHDTCTPAEHENIYSIDLSRIDTYEKALHWTGHLMGKTWLASTNWGAVIRRMTKDIDP